MTRTTLIALTLSVALAAPALASEPDDFEHVDFGPELTEVLDAVRLHQALDVLTHPLGLRPQFRAVELMERPAPFDTCARLPRPWEVDRIDEETLVYRIELNECEISLGERVTGTVIFHPSFLDVEDPKSRRFFAAARSWARSSAEGWYSLDVVTDTGTSITAYGERTGDLDHYEEQVDMTAAREGSVDMVDAMYSGHASRLAPVDAIRSDGQLLVLVGESILTVEAERLGRLDGDATPCVGAYVYDGEEDIVELVWSFRSRKDEKVLGRVAEGTERLSLPHF